MKKAYVLLIFLLMGLGLGLLIKSNQSLGQVRSNSNSNSASTDIPIVDFDSQELNAIVRENSRVQRNNRYSSAERLDQIKASGIMDDPQYHAKSEPGLPVNLSDLVVIGTINNSQAFLSDDKTGIHSEFEVEINQLLFSRAENVAIGSKISAARMGGKVRFATGKTLLRGEDGKELPRLHSRYLLFLKFEPLGLDYTIITGYEILGEDVIPLDGRNLPNSKNFREYNQYRNAKLSRLLEDLDHAIKAEERRKI